MARTSVRQMIVALGGGFLAGAALLGLLVVLGADDAVGSEAIRRIGWVVPLVAGLVIGGMALVLLGSDQAEDDTGEFEGSICASCGSPIITEWRLCPHCGALLECDVAMSGIPHSSEQ